jgi:uncharacterized protein YcbK (DUF882 family)
MIQLSDYFKAHADSKEITEQVRKNATVLIARVSTLLSLIPIEKPVITSGFRPSSYNKSIGGSLNSAHCYGLAIDLLDSDKKIGEWCISNIAYLVQEGIYMESLCHTHRSHLPEKRWVHLTTRKPKSGNTVFLPF